MSIINVLDDQYILSIIIDNTYNLRALILISKLWFRLTVCCDLWPYWSQTGKFISNENISKYRTHMIWYCLKNPDSFRKVIRAHSFIEYDYRRFAKMAIQTQNEHMLLHLFYSGYLRADDLNLYMYAIKCRHLNMINLFDSDAHLRDNTTNYKLARMAAKYGLANLLKLIMTTIMQAPGRFSRMAAQDMIISMSGSMIINTERNNNRFYRLYRIYTEYAHEDEGADSDNYDEAIKSSDFDDISAYTRAVMFFIVIARLSIINS